MKILHLIVFAVCTIFTLLASSAVCGQELPFKDVPKGHWAREAIEKCYAAGVFDESNEFHGNDNVSRYDVAKTVDRVLQIIKDRKTSPSSIEGSIHFHPDFQYEVPLLRSRIENLEESVKELMAASKQRQVNLQRSR